MKELSDATKLTKLGSNPDEQFGFVNPPLYKGSTVIYNSADEFRKTQKRFRYGTAGTPTISNLENAWTDLTGAAGTVLSPSWLASITLAFLSFTKAGDHILITDSVYGFTRTFCDGILSKYNVETEYYNPVVGQKIEDLIRPNTTVIFMESPGSHTMEIQDIPAITKIAQKYNIITMIDNTWATPLYFQAHSFGVDVTIEAGTKYLGGHSDLLLGLTTANEKHWPQLRAAYDSTAILPGAEDCILALRGMRSMPLRLKETGDKALKLAKWLQKRPEVLKVLHPALENDPGHEIWKRDFSGSSGVFSIILKSEFSQKNIENMLNNMNIFRMGLSWGGYESLIRPVNPQTLRTVTEWSKNALILRFKVGLEGFEDLRDDLELAFSRLNKGTSFRGSTTLEQFQSTKAKL